MLPSLVQLYIYIYIYIYIYNIVCVYLLNIMIAFTQVYYTQCCKDRVNEFNLFTIKLVLLEPSLMLSAMNAACRVLKTVFKRLLKLD